MKARLLPVLLAAALLALPLVAASTPAGRIAGYPKTLQSCSGLVCVTATLDEAIVECGPAGSGWWGTGGYWCRFRGDYDFVMTGSTTACWSFAVSQPFADDVGSNNDGHAACAVTGADSFSRTDWHSSAFTRSDTIAYELCILNACSTLNVGVTYTAD